MATVSYDGSQRASDRMGSGYGGVTDPFTPRNGGLDRVASHPIAFESDTPLLVSPAQPSPQALLAGGDYYGAHDLRNARSLVGSAAGPPEGGYGKPSEATRASMPSAGGATAGCNAGSLLYPYNPPAGHNAPLTSASAEMLAKRMDLGGYLVNPTPTTSVFPTPATSINPTPATSNNPTPAVSAHQSPMKLPRWAAGLSLSQRTNNTGNNQAATRSARRTLGGAFGSQDVSASVGKPGDADLRRSVSAAATADRRQVLGDIPTNRPLPSCAEDVALSYGLAQAQAQAVALSKAAIKSPEISDSSVLYSGGSGSASGSSYNSPQQAAMYATVAASAGATPQLQASETPLVPPSQSACQPTPRSGDRGVGYWADRADYWNGRAKMHTQTSQQFLPGSMAGLLAMPRVEEGPAAPRNSWAARKQLSQSLDSDALRMAAARTTPLKPIDASPPTPPQSQATSSIVSPARQGLSLAPEDMPLAAMPRPEPVISPPHTSPSKHAAGPTTASAPASSTAAACPSQVQLDVSGTDLSAVVSSVARIKESLRCSQEAGGPLNEDYCNNLESELGKLQACLETFRQSTSQQAEAGKVTSPSPPAVEVAPAALAAPVSLPPAQPTVSQAAAPPSPVMPASRTPSAAKSIGCFACLFPSKNKSQQ